MDRINEFKPCPLCGKTDRLELTPRGTFYSVWHKNDKGSTISVRCYRCGLELHEYTYESTFFNTLHTNNYDIVVGELKKKWNNIKR